MKKTLAVMAVMLMLLPMMEASAQEIKAPVHLRVGTMDLGSAHYVYGATFASLWREVLPKGSTIDVLPYAGGVGNALVLDKGDAELGLLFGLACTWAVQGKVAFDKKMDVITGLVAGLDKYYAGIMATKRSGITSLEDVAKGKKPVRIVSQPMGSASETSMKLILQAYGMSYEDIKSWGGSVTPTATGVAQSQMADGKADIWINMIVAGHPSISELAISTELVFIPMSDEIINKLKAYGYEKAMLPAKTFKGQDQDVAMLGWPTMLVARKDLQPEVAYALTKALVENKEKLVKGHAALKDFLPENAWNFKKYGMPLHPGAAKYYKEKGMLK